MINYRESDKGYIYTVCFLWQKLRRQMIGVCAFDRTATPMWRQANPNSDSGDLR